MESAAAVVLLLLTVSATVISGSAAAVCASELLAISPCLPYVAMAPNNLSSVADPLCCDPFRTASDGVAHCICRLLSEPALLGFPLNLTRLLSLFSFCPANSSLLDADSLQTVCRRIHSEPPIEIPAGESGPPTEISAGESRNPRPVSGFTNYLLTVFGKFLCISAAQKRQQQNPARTVEDPLN
ncbi:non-specific lipid transfer protein GPI-anchored 25 [Aristolochia californica]|uniref:non-specific lipid transfer protein GPI-anchored 25 n=1 Tax=Aristolochia californica TaxID=171875 RepID=UPI0035D6347A